MLLSCQVEEKSKKSRHTAVIVGAVVAVFVFLVLAMLAGIYAFRQKKRAKRAFDLNPFGKIFDACFT